MKKGEYGYLNRKKKRLLIRTALFFAAAFGVYLFGYYSTGTQQNFLTIAAILGMLPACQSAVHLFLFFKAQGIGQEDHAYLSGKLEALSQEALFDLYLTGYEKNYPVFCACFRGEALLLFMPDASGIKEHLIPLMEKEGLEETAIEAFTEREAFLAKAEASSPAGDEETKARLYALLRAVSI